MKRVFDTAHDSIVLKWDVISIDLQSQMFNSPSSLESLEVHFLDLQVQPIIVNQALRLATTTYRKPTFHPQYLHISSKHPFRMRANVIYTESSWFHLNQSESQGDFCQRLQELTKNLEDRGFGESVLYSKHMGCSKEV